MQRIGRVDRRLNPEIEAQLRRPADLDGKIYFWNFLPPDELEDLLGLKKKLDGKILRINATLGIEGSLLTPDDDEMTLIEFNNKYEGKQSVEELMNLERQQIEAEHPELWKSLATLPRRLFSGKGVGAGFKAIIDREGDEVELKANQRAGIFCCYRMPLVLGKAPSNLFEQKNEVLDETIHPKGEVRWYFLDRDTNEVSEDLTATWTAARCMSDTPRMVSQGAKGLSDARKAVEKHIKNTYLRDIEAPMGAKPTLLAWMEIA
jgi:hypothetical protein